jgi:hypothetical protein
MSAVDDTLRRKVDKNTVTSPHDESRGLLGVERHALRPQGEHQRASRAEHHGVEQCTGPCIPSPPGRGLLARKVKGKLNQVAGNV